MMKNSAFILVLIIAALFFNACKDDTDCDCNGSIIGEWKTESFLSLESTGYPKDDEYSPVITFRNDGTYTLVLDVNGCSGEYVSDSDDNINISTSICTKMCCDSDFSEKLVGMLPQVNSFSINDKELSLIVPGWGFIVLSRISN